MSPRNSDTAPSPDIYVGLLMVSFAALVTGIIFLVLEIQEYQWQVSP